MQIRVPWWWFHEANIYNAISTARTIIYCRGNKLTPTLNSKIWKLKGNRTCDQGIIISLHKIFRFCISGAYFWNRVWLSWSRPVPSHQRQNCFRCFKVPIKFAPTRKSSCIQTSQLNLCNLHSFHNNIRPIHIHSHPHSLHRRGDRWSPLDSDIHSRQLCSDTLCSPMNKFRALASTHRSLIKQRKWNDLN